MVQNIKYNKNSGTEFLIVISLFYVFISHFKIFSITSYSAMIKLALVGIFPIIFILQNIKNIKISLLDILWINLIVLFLVSTIVASDKGLALFSTLKLIVFFISYYQLSRIYDWYNRAIKLLLILSGVHVIATILHVILPDIVNTINMILLNSKSYSVVMDLFSYGYYSGIAGQTSFNALYIMVFISIIYSKVINEDKNLLKNSITLLIGYCAMFLTNKRGPLVAIIVAQIITYVIFYLKPNKKNIKIVAGLILTTFIMFILINNVEAFQSIIKRFEITENFTSNRDILFDSMIAGIKESFLYGCGAGSLGVDLGVGGHNIYLQILYENGILGFIGILSILYFNLRMCYKAVRLSIKERAEYIFILISSFVYQISFCIYGLTESVFFNPTMFISYIVFISIPISILYKIKEDKRKEVMI